jgi:hypothetical protein
MIKHTVSNTEAQYYYLCADLHLYQAGTININNGEMIIKQYIVGTGGNKQINLTNINKNYSKSLSIESEYTNLKEQLNISFSYVSEEPQILDVI